MISGSRRESAGDFFGQLASKLVVLGDELWTGMAQLPCPLESLGNFWFQGTRDSSGAPSGLRVEDTVLQWGVFSSFFRGEFW